MVVGLKWVWSDGTSAIVLSPAELVERLIYRGVLAGNAGWRAEVVPKPKPVAPDAAAARRARRLTRLPRINLVDERPSRADLLLRVFAVDGFACPGCGGPLALRCVVINPPPRRGFWAGSSGPPVRHVSASRATTGRRDHAGPEAEPRAGDRVGPLTTATGPWTRAERRLTAGGGRG